MNKKVLILSITIVVLAMGLSPFAFAKPWEYPKNNDKFETFETSFVPNLVPIGVAIADPEYIPSEANQQKAITSWVELMDEYTITVNGVPYSLHDDFEYTGVAVITANGAPFAPTGPMGAIYGKQNHFRVEYMYDFSGGDIEGTIKMLALVTSGPNRVMHIRSLQGTGDLQNVQIQATAAGGFAHTGVVIGWPDPPP